MDQEMPVKIFGERRSGTKAIRDWIGEPELPYHWTSATGWKHGIPTAAEIAEIGPGVRRILCVKHPLAWLVSMHQNPCHMEHMSELSFAEFLTAEWDETDIRDKRGQLAPQKYRRVYRNIFDLRYRKLAAHLGVPQIEIVHCEWIPKGVPNHSGREQPVDFYAREQWREYYDDETLKLALAGIDRALETQIGYSVT